MNPVENFQTEFDFQKDCVSCEAGRVAVEIFFNFTGTRFWLVSRRSESEPTLGYLNVDLPFTWNTVVYCISLRRLKILKFVLLYF